MGSRREKGRQGSGRTMRVADARPSKAELKEGLTTGGAKGSSTRDGGL